MDAGGRPVILDVLATFAAGYFLGAIPVAYLVARAVGRDIFEVGSGNMGSMNTARNVGTVPGILVFALDIGKGALASWLGLQMASVAGGEPLAFALIAGVGAVTGHAWSVFVRFRGGKALASAFGLTLPVVPWVGVAALIVLVALILITRRATFGSILTLALFPVITSAVLARQGWPLEDIFTAATASVFVAGISIAKHVRAAQAGKAD